MPVLRRPRVERYVAMVASDTQILTCCWYDNDALEYMTLYAHVAASRYAYAPIVHASA